MNTKTRITANGTDLTITKIRVYPHSDEAACGWAADDLAELRESGVNPAEDGRWAVVEFSDGSTVEFDADTDGWAPSDRRDGIRHDYAWLDEAAADLLAAMNA